MTQPNPETANPRTLDAALDLCVRVETEAARLLLTAGAMNERFLIDEVPREVQLRSIASAIETLKAALTAYRDELSRFEIPQSTVMGG